MLFREIKWFVIIVNSTCTDSRAGIEILRIHYSATVIEQRGVSHNWRSDKRCTLCQSGSTCRLIIEVELVEVTGGRCNRSGSSVRSIHSHVSRCRRSCGHIQCSPDGIIIPIHIHTSIHWIRIYSIIVYIILCGRAQSHRIAKHNIHTCVSSYRLTDGVLRVQSGRTCKVGFQLKCVGGNSVCRWPCIRHIYL